MWYNLIERAKNEPAFVGAFIEVLIALFVSFGLNLDGEQVAAIMAVVAVLTGAGVRQRAYGPKTVSEILDADAVIRSAEARGVNETYPVTPEESAFFDALDRAEREYAAGATVDLDDFIGESDGR